MKIENLGKNLTSGESLFNGLSFTMNKGDKIALIGRNSTVITAIYDILSGKVMADSGTIEWGQTITNDYLPNENIEFFTKAHDLQLMDWLRQYSRDKDEQFIRSFLGRMLFSGEEVYKHSSVLSGGEKVRCMLSKIMLKNPNFLLLDEPTNHLDLESITALNNALRDFTGNLIMTSHDHKLLDTACNRIIEITDGGIIDRLMSYDEYVRSPKIRAIKAEMMAAVV